MKRVVKYMGLLLPVILVISISAGCKKTKVQVTLPVTGKWRLVAQKGGISGGNLPLPVAVPTYTLNTDSTYSQTPDKRSGIFHVTLKKSIFTGSEEHYIFFSNSADMPGLIALKNDTLIISDNHVDPISSFYARVK